MQLSVTVVAFKRNKDSDEEQGIAINDDRIIIDAAGRVVKAPLWNYRLQTHLGHVLFDLDTL